MKLHGQESADRDEQLSPEVYRELGEQGWRLPLSEPEVAAAEDWVSKTPDRLPEGLRETPELDNTPEPGGLLSRYLQQPDRSRPRDDPKPRDDGRAGRDLDR